MTAIQHDIAAIFCERDRECFQKIFRAYLKRRHVYVAVWLHGRSAEIIEPFYLSIIKNLKYYNITNSSQFARKYTKQID